MKNKIAIIGLGYVGINLAVEFGRYYTTIGYDINLERIKQLKVNIDVTKEVSKKKILSAKKLNFTNDINKIQEAEFKIITVPTPVTDAKSPDLSYIRDATINICKFLNKKDIIIYESTTYPGCTENYCRNLIEKKTGFKFNEDFFLGYSPERVNPADKKNSLINVKKVISASNNYALSKIKTIYNKIIRAGTYTAKNIKTAEMTKLIENVQRDINIALINEISIISKKLDINIYDVIDAASTKWNFLPFNPGFVGGHCIGIDPYYLSYVSTQNDFIPQLITSVRSTNENMARYAADLVIKSILKNFKRLEKVKISILGITFKENCPDIRNSKIVDIINILKENFDLRIYDPFADSNEVFKNFSLKILNEIEYDKANVILFCVGHNQYRFLKEDEINNMFKKNNPKLLFDFKNIFKSKKLHNSIEKITL